MFGEWDILFMLIRFEFDTNFTIPNTTSIIIIN